MHPLQNKLEAEYLRLNQVLVLEDSPTEKTKATKRLKVLTKQMDELKKYDEVIHNLADQQIEIDIDDSIHVAAATFTGCNAIVSWNFKHILKLRAFIGVNGVNRMLGYGEIALIPPYELLEEDD